MRSRVATIDFETESIKDFATDKAFPRPVYPPEPVGCAVRLPGKKSRYLAWGHPTGNNCTKAEAVARLRDVWRDFELSGWNMKFDLDVAETRLGLKPARGFRDVQFKAFLDDPNCKELSLKPTAERVLGLPPDERDAVRDWIFANVPEMKGQPKTSRRWGGFICRAPGSLVAPYAIGDVDRTHALDVHYDEDVLVKRGMREAYEREVALLPRLLEMERERVPVDEPALRRDLARWERWIVETDGWLRRRLRCADLNLDSNDDLADALERSGDVKEWILTEPSKRFPNGQRSTARENLMQVVLDPALREVLTYRAKLTACVRMIGVPWVAMMDAAGKPSICTTWNQTKDYAQDHATGARTGRLSSQPNFQNIPTTEPHNKERGAACPCPACGLKRLPADLRRRVGALPAIRNYIAPPRGFAFIDRDFSQQEFRILADYEGGPLMRAYLADPKLDVHDLACELVNRRLQKNYNRRSIKAIGLGLIYGMGKEKLSIAAGVEVDVSQAIKRAYFEEFPGLPELSEKLKARARAGEPIRTAGGREYHCEPARVVRGRVQTFEYKMLNTLIQGSAADQIKEAMRRYYEHPKRRGRLLLTVHDELLAMCPARAAREEDAVLRECMESVAYCVPMLTDGDYGEKSWGELKG